MLSRLRIDPYLMALAVTVALAALLPARGAAATWSGWAVSVAIGLLFFLYGTRLSPRAIIEGLSHWRLQSLVLVSTFVLFPAVGLALTAALHRWLPPALAFGLVYVCLLPSTVQSSIAFTSIARGNVPAALCSASVSNLLGMVATPALVALLLSGRGGFDAKALGDIAVQMLLPFAAGQVLRPLIGAFVGRHRTLTSFVDRGSILIIVYTAFSDSVVTGLWSHVGLPSLGLVLLLDAVLLALVLLGTTLLSRCLGFSTEDEIAIVFCGSKKSMAAGLSMARVLFPGQAVGAIALPLILFHQIQLFACAALAGRYARRAPGAPASSAIPILKQS